MENEARNDPALDHEQAPTAPPCANSDSASTAAVAPIPTDGTAGFAKRNWTDKDTLALVQAWHAVHKEGRGKDEKTGMHNSRIYAAFRTALPDTKRSKKAMEDKVQALREMYRFVRDVNANRIAGSTGKPNWFELSKKEKRELRTLHRMKSPNITLEVFEELNQFLNDKPDTVPLPSTFRSQPCFAAEDANRAVATSGCTDLFPEPVNGSTKSKDPYNTGKRNSKRKRDSKLESVREILEERSKELFEQAEKLQQEEMRERRVQHAEKMSLLRELITAITGTSNAN